MTTLIERPATVSPSHPDNHLAVSPADVITAIPGHRSVLDLARGYFTLGERPIPL